MNAVVVDPAIDLKSRLDALEGSQRLSPSQTEAIYSAAYRFLEQGHFDTAREFFAVLMLMRPSEVKYLQGLAISLRQLRRHAEAAEIWQFIGMLEPHESAHGLAQAECLLLAGDRAGGLACLERVVAAAGDGAATAATRERAGAILGLIRSKEGAAS